MAKIATSNLVLKSNQKEVSLDELKGTGQSFNGVTFLEGDVVTIPSGNELRFYEGMFKTATGKDAKTWGISVYINDRDEPRWVSLGSFRKKPYGSLLTDFISGSDMQVNRQLIEAGDNYDLACFLSGKKLRVKAMKTSQVAASFVAGEDGNTRVATDKDGNPILKDAKFPVWEFIS